MMRIGFLPSDFNPMILMLVEAEDCRALSGVLRSFAREPRTVSFNSLGFCRRSGTNLTLAADLGPSGVHRTPDATFLWRIPPDLAAAFADRLDDLAEPSRIAGSEELDCGTEEGIRIKVSRGEYTDDFLLPAAPDRATLH